MTSSRYAVGATLFLALAASQAAVLGLTPVLAAVASDLGVSTAVAGQLRTVSGLSAGITALCTGLLRVSDCASSSRPVSCSSRRVRL